MTTIYFDMDGTIADLYGVENWLEDITNYSTRPYEIAKPLVALSVLAQTINGLQKAGYKLGIVSWCSRSATEDFNMAIVEAKRKWLAKHMPSVSWDEIHIVEYGTPKYAVVENENGILFDDEKPNRDAWKGTAYDVDNIINILRGLLYA